MSKQKMTLEDAYRTFFPDDDNAPRNPKKDKGAKGILEFIIKDKHGNVVEQWMEPNLVKIFAKEMLAHRLPSSEAWDINANSGSGGWVATGIDVTEEFSARYILLGASFDANGVALDTNDPRFYTTDEASGQPVPIRLSPGADYDGGLINAIPLSEPDRPLKRVESIGFQATFQPAGTPLLQSDVRGMNNIVTLQTTLRLGEYNGLGVTESDFFTITEIALAGGKKFDSIGQCDCNPRSLFLEGASAGSTGGTLSSTPIPATANGNDVVTLDSAYASVVKEGDQIKIVSLSDSASEESISQVSPFYLVISKAAGGRDCQLDRVPVDTNNNAIVGNIGVYRDTLRLFSHRVLSSPIKKSSDFEITIIWRIIFS